MYSRQEVTSDGTLNNLLIAIEFFDRSEIHVFADGIENGVAWTWGVGNQIVFTSGPVPLGVTILVHRTTDISKIRHAFSLGAAFTAPNLDEDLKQVLHIAQESVEGNLSGDFFNDVDLHGNRILHVADAVDPTDAPNFGQLGPFRADAQAAAVAALAAQAAAEAAAASIILPVPVVSGGTGATTAAAARTNLGVPSSTGGGASGTWPISIQSENSIFQQAGAGALVGNTRDELRRTVHIRQFATGTGGDETAAVQAFIDAAAGGVGVVDGGTYLVSSLTIPSNTTIVGTGKASAIIKRIASAPSNSPLLNLSNTSGVTLRDFTVDGNKAAQTNGANNIEAAGSESLTIAGCRVTGAKATPGYGVGVLLNDGTNDTNFKQTRIVGNDIDFNGDAGVYASKESFLYIAANMIKNNNDGVIVINYVFPPVQYVQNYIHVAHNNLVQNTVAGVRFVGGYTGGTPSLPFVSPLAPPSKGVFITGNNARENGQYGIVYQGASGVITNNYVARNGTTIDDGGILLSAWDSVCNDNVVEDNAAYGIDCGGSFNCTFNGNSINYQGATSGFQATGLNIGGSVWCQAVGNSFESNGGSGSASIYASGYEYGGGYLENIGSNLLLANNTIKLGNTNAIGIYTNHGMDNVQLLGNQVFGGAANRAYILEGGLNDFKLMERNNIDWSNGDMLPSIASAATTVIPDIGDDFLITGTTGITTLRTFSSDVYAGKVRYVQISNGGSGYNPASPPTVSFSGGGGTGAAGTALVANSGKIIGVQITNTGSGYTSAPAVSFSSGAAAGVARIGCDNFKGRTVTLRFSGALTVTNGSNLLLAGNFTSGGGASILVLRGAFGNWYEVSRRV